MNDSERDELLGRCRARVDLTSVSKPVVCGCSGGADSLALLVLAADAGLSPVAVYVDHGLRDDVGADVEAVRHASDTLGLTYVVEHVTVEAGPNLEARARDARYAALERAREDTGADDVLVGHTADDQAETILLHVLRGAAASGLAGMPARRGAIVRPLLGMRRAETRALCDAFGLPAVADPMNEDPRFRRVVIREQVLPMLERLAARDLVPVLTRQADLLRAESDFLDTLAAAAWPDGSPPSASGLCALDPVLARRALRRWVGPPPPSLAEVERMLDVAAGHARVAQLAGGRRVRRSKGRLLLDCE